MYGPFCRARTVESWRAEHAIGVNAYRRFRHLPRLLPGVQNAPYRRDGGATGQAFCSHVRWDSEQARSARIADFERLPR
jgi:hypothetical protein